MSALDRSGETPAEEDMMLSVNKVILMGVLADQPVVRAHDDRKIIGLSVFTIRPWSQEGKKQALDKEWHRVVITHPDLAAYAEACLSKDDPIYLEGELQTTSWLDATYVRQSLTRILLWQDGDRLRRIDDEGVKPAATPDLMAVAQDAHLFELGEEGTEWR
jgi:hypothetical protein